jgi:hypothetical protein
MMAPSSSLGVLLPNLPMAEGDTNDFDARFA